MYNNNNNNNNNKHPINADMRGEWYNSSRESFFNVVNITQYTFLFNAWRLKWSFYIKHIDEPGFLRNNNKNTHILKQRERERERERKGWGEKCAFIWQKAEIQFMVSNLIEQIDTQR